ncbi:AAA family ATPase [Kitasatospora camelliae]|uniref:AAA family ATPase n=1 Tax=Kitasatospora camelliae TaxID=3156397 RepID=A0AAU8JPX3_9ACTN
MIVWVNGAFGSGKSTLVEELRPRWPQALVLDPEMVGFVLRTIVDVPTGDFQDLRLWRRQVAAMAIGLVEEYDRPLLVPMTLVNPEYLGEVFDALREEGIEVHHFFLKVPEEVLHARIDGRSFTPDDPAQDEQVRTWCKSKLAACLAAVDTLPPDTVLLDGESTPEELAATVLARVGVTETATETAGAAGADDTP